MGTATFGHRSMIVEAEKKRAKDKTNNGRRQPTRKTVENRIHSA